MVKLSAGAFDRCGTIIASRPKGKPLSAEWQDDALFARLVAGSFVVEDDFDELAFIEEQYNRENAGGFFIPMCVHPAG